MKFSRTAKLSKQATTWLWLLCLVTLALLAAALAHGMGTRPRPGLPVHLPQSSPRLSPESLLVKSLLEIRHNRLDVALNDINNLLHLNPNFRLAHLIKGDLLMARAHPISTLGDVHGGDASQHVEGMRDEARKRLQRYVDQPPTGQIPKYLVQFEPEQKYAVVVDTSRSRLYLFQNVQGEPRYVTDFYVTSGKKGSDKVKEGDQRTPLGVYFVTSHLAKSKLSDFYGTGAFPISYPNEWDKRLGRNGYGIWLHGVPSDTYSRPPRASSGCVVLTNPDLDELGKYIQIGLTPVIISDGIEWMDAAEWRVQHDKLSKQLETWRTDWETRNTDSYLGHYSKNFASGKLRYGDWSSQKRQVNAGKTWIKVNLSRVSVFRYPGQDNMAVVTFQQDYRSNNLSNQMRKRQYWLQEDGHWKIVYEGSA